MSKNIDGFYLENIIEKKSKNLTIKQKTNFYINQLVLKCNLLHREEDFTELLSIIYSVGSLKHKIYRSSANSYSTYCSQEDLFAVFCDVTQSCLNKYNREIGDFKNYVLKYIDLAFIEARKQSFLKVTGQIDKNKKTVFSNKPIENYEISVKELFAADEQMMNEQLIEKIKKIPDGEILIYKYLSSDKVKSNQDVAKYFGLTLKQVRTRLEKINTKFKKENKTFFNDYFYDTDNAGELSWVEFVA